MQFLLGVLSTVVATSIAAGIGYLFKRLPQFRKSSYNKIFENKLESDTQQFRDIQKEKLPDLVIAQLLASYNHDWPNVISDFDQYVGQVSIYLEKISELWVKGRIGIDAAIELILKDFNGLSINQVLYLDRIGIKSRGSSYTRIHNQETFLFCDCIWMRNYSLGDGSFDDQYLFNNKIENCSIPMYRIRFRRVFPGFSNFFNRHILRKLLRRAKKQHRRDSSKR